MVTPASGQERLGQNTRMSRQLIPSPSNHSGQGSHTPPSGVSIHSPKQSIWSQWILQIPSKSTISITFNNYYVLYLLIDLDVNLVPLSVAANQWRGYMEIPHCDWLPLKVGQDWRRGWLIMCQTILMFNLKRYTTIALRNFEDFLKIIRKFYQAIPLLTGIISQFLTMNYSGEPFFILCFVAYNT